MADVNLPGGFQIKNLKYFTEFLLLVFTAAMVGTATMLYYTDADARKERTEIKAQQTEVAQAITKLADVMHEMNKEQRLQTCINSRPESQRKEEFTSPTSYCRQITGTTH